MATQDIALAHAPPTWTELFSGRNAFYALALAGGVTLHAVNIYIVTTVLPSVVAEIGGLDYYAWSTTLFVVASIMGAALSARLLQRAGARSAYAIAALLFTAGTLACGLAPNMPVMLAGRFVQGFGGGFLYALAYSVIRLVLPERLWPRAIGLISAMWGIATLIGPAIGGVFAQYDAWRAAFLVVAPVAVAFALLALRTLPKSGAAKASGTPLPIVQIALLVGAVLAVSAGSVAADLAWNVVGVVAALALVVLLVVAERWLPNRLLPANALNPATPMGALYATIALLVLGMQPEIFVSYFLQVLHGLSPIIAGYIAALMAIGWTAGSMLGSGWTGGAARSAIRGGPLAVLAGLAILAATLPTTSGDRLLLAAASAGLLLVGLGIGIAWPHIVTQVFRVAPPAEQQQATAAVTTVQLFATAFGAATAGLIANAAGLTAPGGSTGAESAALWLFVAFTLAPAACLAAARRAARF